jgi:hypothetical protein
VGQSHKSEHAEVQAETIPNLIGFLPESGAPCIMQRKRGSGGHARTIKVESVTDWREWTCDKPAFARGRTGVTSGVLRRCPRERAHTSVRWAGCTFIDCSTCPNAHAIEVRYLQQRLTIPQIAEASSPAQRSIVRSRKGHMLMCAVVQRALT